MSLSTTCGAACRTCARPCVLVWDHVSSTKCVCEHHQHLSTDVEETCVNCDGKGRVVGPSVPGVLSGWALMVSALNYLIDAERRSVLARIKSDLSKWEGK